MRRLLYAKSPQWAEIALRREPDFAAFTVLKRTGRTLAGIYSKDGVEFFYKCSATAGWLKGVAERLRGSRAARSRRGASMLAEAGFACPQILAAAEERSLGAIRSSWVISEKLDARIMSVFALAGGRDFARRLRASQAVAREVRRLHDAGIFTHDLQETNLMLRDAGGSLQIYFVDLEDFRRVRRLSIRRRLLNLVHLDRSIGRFVSRGQRLRFFYYYLGGRQPRDEARRLLRKLFAIRRQLERRRVSVTKSAHNEAGQRLARPAAEN
jgi:tRNA A-37 threonylcarbamoyl transferase component Bud32